MRNARKSTLTNGQKLHSWRLQNKMTQKVLGELLGKNFRTISQYETGSRSIPNTVISKLNKEYHLKLAYTDNRSKAVVKLVENSKKASVKKYSFAQRIINIRKSMKLNQAAFAKKFHFVPSHLWNIEKGNTDRISITNLKALSAAGVDLNSLVK